MAVAEDRTLTVLYWQIECRVRVEALEKERRKCAAWSGSMVSRQLPELPPRTVLDERLRSAIEAARSRLMLRTDATVIGVLPEPTVTREGRRK